MKRDLVLIGAGSAMFCRSVVRELIADGGEWELRLVDTSDEALDVACRLAERLVAAAGARITVRGSTDRRRLLAGADAVVTTIGVGGRRAWEQDVFIPRRFGIFQPVGDSAGPGGISRALRMIPALVEIARDVAELAPRATLINYSNPMAANCRAITEEAGTPVIGLCIGVRETLSDLARLIEVPADELEWSAIGVTHLTWITELAHEGRDAWPMVDAALARRPEGRGENPATWELYDAYRAVAAPFDRHVTEFFGGWMGERAYYGRTLGIDVFSFEGTIAWGESIYREMVELADGRRDAAAEATGGEPVEAIPILRTLWGDRPPSDYSLNVPNDERVTNLPPAAILEGTARVERERIQPRRAGELPAGIAAVLQRHAAVQELGVEAALSGDRRLVVQAMLAEGFIASPARAGELTDALLRAHRSHLPQF